MFAAPIFCELGSRVGCVHHHYVSRILKAKIRLSRQQSYSCPLKFADFPSRESCEDEGLANIIYGLYSTSVRPLSGGQNHLVNTAEATLSCALTPIMSDQVTSVQAMSSRRQVENSGETPPTFFHFSRTNTGEEATSSPALALSPATNYLSTIYFCHQL